MTNTGMRGPQNTQATAAVLFFKFIIVISSMKLKTRFGLLRAMYALLAMIGTNIVANKDRMMTLVKLEMNSMIAIGPPMITRR